MSWPRVVECDWRLRSKRTPSCKLKWEKCDKELTPKVLLQELGSRGYKCSMKGGKLSMDTACDFTLLSSIIATACQSTRLVHELADTPWRAEERSNILVSKLSSMGWIGYLLMVCDIHDAGASGSLPDTPLYVSDVTNSGTYEVISEHWFTPDSSHCEHGFRCHAIRRHSYLHCSMVKASDSP